MWVILLDLPAQCAWVRASSHSGKLWHERLTKSKIARGRKFNSKKSSLPCSREEREERERGGGDPSSTLRSPPPAWRPTILSLTKVASTFPRKRRGFKSPRRQNYEWAPNATELDKQDRFRAIFFLQKNEWKRKKWCKFSNHDRMKKKFKWRPPFKNSSPQQLFKNFFFSNLLRDALVRLDCSIDLFEKARAWCRTQDLFTFVYYLSTQQCFGPLSYCSLAYCSF